MKIKPSIERKEVPKEVTKFVQDYPGITSQMARMEVYDIYGIKFFLPWLLPSAFLLAVDRFYDFEKVIHFSHFEVVALVCFSLFFRKLLIFCLDKITLELGKMKFENSDGE